MRLSLVIKKENVDLEKQANKLNKILVLHKPLLFLFALFFVGFFGAQAQDRIPFDQGTKYFLGNVKVTGKLATTNKPWSLLPV